MKPMKYRISKYGFVVNNGRGDLIVFTKIHWTFKICFVLKPQWLMRFKQPLYFNLAVGEPGNTAYKYICVVRMQRPRKQKCTISKISLSVSHSWCNLLLISASCSTFLSRTPFYSEKLTTSKKTGAAGKNNVFIISTMIVTSTNECSVENVVKTAN